MPATCCSACGTVLGVTVGFAIGLFQLVDAGAQQIYALAAAFVIGVLMLRARRRAGRHERHDVTHRRVRRQGADPQDQPLRRQHTRRRKLYNAHHPTISSKVFVFPETPSFRENALRTRVIAPIASPALYGDRPPYCS